MKFFNVILLAIALMAVSCKKDDVDINTPSSVEGVTVEPVVGGALVKWTLPADSNFLYVQVSYQKNGKTYLSKSSKYVDSIVIDGLLNKHSYDFEVQTVNEVEGGQKTSEVTVVNGITPIRRPVEVTYFSNQLTKIEGVTADMLDTYTQETTEGPKESLIDGNLNSYWHSAWSSNTAPLPHWIQYSAGEKIKMGAIKYNFRQSASEAGRPTQFGLGISEDGSTWERVWTSKSGLPVTPVATEQVLPFDANYESAYFRVMITSTSGNTTYAHLSEISFYTMKEDLVDKEVEFEDQHY